MGRNSRDKKERREIARALQEKLQGDPHAVGQITGKWTPFEEAVYSEEHAKQIKKDRLGRVCRVWLNSRYQVEVTIIQPPKGSQWPVMTWLSIKRRDKNVIRDWRDLQRIKNELCGPESEGVELFPAESRLVDTSNQYHCWVFPNGIKLPIPLEAAMAKPGPKRKPIEQRLWSKVDLTGGPEACWPFMGARDGENGYGKLSQPGDSTGKPSYYAHRVAYAIANGLDVEDLPDNQEVRHVVCDNPPCCNPAHLLLGSSADNKADATAKGRMFWQRAQRSSSGTFLPGEEESSDDEEDGKGRFHLWVLPPGERWPFGYGERLIIKATPEEDVDQVGKARQRPFDPEDEPADAITSKRAEELVAQMPREEGHEYQRNPK